MRIVFLFILAFSGIFSHLKAQGEAAVPFLLIQPSANLNGMAGAYTALPTNDTFGAYYNPAQLGFFGQCENFSYQYMKVDWLPSFNFSDLYFKSQAFQVGYNFKNIKSFIPISVGVGYMRGYLNLGKNVWTDETGAELGTFDSKEWYDAFSIGANFSYFVDVSIGITYKSIVSKLAPITVYSNGESYRSVADPKAHDLGFLFSLPIHKFYLGMFEKIATNDFKLLPVTILSIGMVKNNIGGKVFYIDQTQADPLPRQAKIGYSLNLGLNMELNEVEMNLFNFQHSSEANDMLVKKDTSGRFEYQSFPGDINMNENIINKKGNSSVINRNGYSFEILEFIKISKGKFQGHGYSEIRTNGYTISCRGLLKVISGLFQSAKVRKILPHFDLIYSKSKYDPKEGDHPLNKTEFQSITLSVYGF